MEETRCPACGQKIKGGRYCLVASKTGIVSVFRTLPDAVQNWTTSNRLRRWNGHEPVDLMPGEYDYADDLVHGRVDA